MVEFQAQDYASIRDKILEKISVRPFYNGKICGVTIGGVPYKLILTIMYFAKEERVVPIWWEMLTFNYYGDNVLNEFDFKELKFKK